MVKVKKWVASLLSLCLLAGVIPLSSALAVSYSGKGTKSNPYLVETAEQLMGISTNLSACYKLNNTIDLKNVAFKPIGNLAKPFTGSFTCDTDSDGTPKYAIKNALIKGKEYKTLAQQNNAFKNDKTNEWETGLFRTTNGATLSNIALLDATVTSHVIGADWQNSNGSFNKGIDQLGTGVLVGIAQNSTITGCIVTGKVTAAHAAGLLAGCAKTSTVQKCYTVGEVSSTGKWCIGAFIGSIENSTIKNSFAEGKVVATGNQAPSAFGAVGKSAAIENCYFSGTVNPACDFTNPDETSKITNCSMSPKDVGVKKITNLAKYVPKAGTVTTTPNQNGNSSTTNNNTTTTIVTDSAGDNNTTPDNTASEGEQSPSLTAEELIQKLTDAEVAQAKGWDFDEAYAVLALKEQYAAMSPEEAEKVNDGYLTLMSTLCDGAQVIVVAGLTDRIDALPTPEKITAENAKKALDTCEKFYSLPEDIQTLFTAARRDKIKACYEKAKEMQDVRVINQTVKASASTAEKLLIIVLMAINALLLAAAVTLAILVFHRVKRKKQDISSMSAVEGGSEV